MDESALLQSVIDDPDADAPRLVFADFLDDRAGPGDADRAEFIRVSIEAEPLLDASPRAVELRDRADFLLQSNAARWQPRSIPAADGVAFYYRRGFIEQVTLPATRFFAQPNAVFGVGPVRSLRLACRGRVSALAVSQCAQLSKLRALELSGDLDDSCLEQVAQSPHLRDLVELAFAGHTATDAGVAALGRAEWPRLEVLALRPRGAVSELAWGALRHSTAMPRLRMLFE